MILTIRTFFNRELVAPLIFLKVSCGLLKRPEWALGGRLVMERKFAFGKITGWVPQAYLFSIIDCTGWCFGTAVVRNLEFGFYYSFQSGGRCYDLAV